MSRSTSGRVARWLPVVLRVVAVTITLYPALRKFLEYPYRVGEFRAYGIPWPEVAVPLTGIIEPVAIVSIGLGVAGRFGAGALVVGMFVAVVAAGPNPFNVLVLFASAGICLLGTGPYSYWPLSRRSVMGGTERTKSALRFTQQGETE